MTITIICSETPCAVSQSHASITLLYQMNTQSLSKLLTQCQFFVHVGPNNQSASKISHGMEMKQHVLISLQYLSVTTSKQQFTYCSNLNELAYLMLQLQCTNLPTVPITMKQQGCWYQFTYYFTFNAVARLQLQFNVPVYLLF